MNDKDYFCAVKIIQGSEPNAMTAKLADIKQRFLAIQKVLTGHHCITLRNDKIRVHWGNPPNFNYLFKLIPQKVNGKEDLYRNLWLPDEFF